MPGQFYARYVPPVASGSTSDDPEKDINPRPVKRTKVEKPTKSTLSEKSSTVQESLPKAKKSKKSTGKESLPEEDDVEESPTKPKKVKKSKLKKHQESVNEPEDAESTDDIDDKHKSIRSKFKKAQQKTQNLASDEEAEDDGTILERVEPVGIQPLPQPKRVKTAPQSNISALPEWLRDPIKVKADQIAAFSELRIGAETVQRLAKAGFRNAFAIQTAVLPMLLPGPKRYRGDICVSAATGSGKTFAYTLPIIEALKDKPITRLRALIVVPTRELVSQVQNVFRMTGSSLEVGTAVGNKSLSDEREALIEVDEVYDPEAYAKLERDLASFSLSLGQWQRDRLAVGSAMRVPKRKNYVFELSSKVEVLIATPGRLVEHIQSTKGFTLEHLQWLVIDEADRLLDQSFQQWVDVVLPAIEKPQEAAAELATRFSRLSYRPAFPLRKIVLSATMTRDYSKLVSLHLDNPKLVVIEGQEQKDDGDEMAVDSDQPLMSIPVSLQETAITIKDAAEKPLYLIQLIEEDLESNTNSTAPPGILQHPEITDPEDSDTTSSSGSSSSDSDSTDEASSSDSASATDLDSESDSTSSSGSSFDTEGPPITSENPPFQAKPHGHLIFTSTSESALRLSRLLTLLRPEWQISTLTRSLTSSSSRKTLRSFISAKADKVAVLIATDLASRGLDLANLAHVVNYDLPKSLTSYVHRVGRTARAGRAGKATTLVEWSQGRWFWAEIGKNTGVGRIRRVMKKKMELVVDEEGRKRYEIALGMMGEEAKGGT